MPGAGAFGWLYPGGSFEEDGGGATEYTKVGSGVSEFVASGADAATLTEVGIGVAGFTAVGSDEPVYTETATGISPFTASGAGFLGATYEKTGIAISGFDGSGADEVIHDEAGSAVSPFTSSAADETIYDEAAAGIAPFVAAGLRGGQEADKFGAAVSAFTASGDGVATDATSGTAILERIASGASLKSSVHFPVDAARTVTDGSTVITNQPFNLPTPTASGDILIGLARAAASSTITWPAGWTEITESTGDPSDDTQSIAWRLCDGSETSTITVTLGTARRMAGVCVRITGGGTPLFSAVGNSGGNSSPDGPSHSPAGGEKNYLWLTIGGTESTPSLGTPPTNYINAALQSASGASGASTCTAIVASRQLRTATENPGAWSIGSVQWMLYTVAIPSSGAVKSNIAISPHTGEGGYDVEMVETGAGIAPLVAFAPEPELNYYNQVGDGIAPFVASGERAGEKARSGAAVSAFTAAGTNEEAQTTEGTAISERVASGAKTRTAFPIDAARAFSDQPNSVAWINVQIPGPCSPGDILIATVRHQFTPSHTWPAGWTEVAESGADPSDDTQSIAWRLCDGTESNQITVNFNVSGYSAGVCVRVTGGGTPLFSSVSSSGLAQPNGPSFSPAGGEKNYLWLTMGGLDRNNRTLYSGPDNYSNVVFFAGGSPLNFENVSAFTASRQLRAATEDPGAWTLNLTGQWMMWTVAVPSSGVLTSGTAISPHTGSGAKTFGESSWTGAGVASFSASGAVETSFYAKAGAAISAFVGSGAREKERLRAGAGVLTGTVSGTALDANVKTGRAESARVVSARRLMEYNQRNKSATFAGLGWTLGRSHSASGAITKFLAKQAIGIIVFTGKVHQGDNYQNTVVSGFSVSGHKGGSTWNRSGNAQWGQNGFSFTQFNGTSDIEIGRAGFTVRGFAASAANAITYSETGAGVSERTVNGSSFSPGTAISVFTGSGASESVYEESGTGISEFTARGFQNPAGTAIAPFSGGGNLKRLYTNDMFVNREQIDTGITGDIDIDSGARSWQVAGGTQFATTETGERLVGIQSMGNTLWWELQVPFRCLVRLFVTTTNGTQFQCIGLASKGTAVNATTAYSDARLHFGQDSGRGMDSGYSAQTPTSWGQIPSPFQTNTPIYVQVDPSTPLVLNFGKNVSSVPASHTKFYIASITRLEPPRNDNISSALNLDTDSGSLPLSMANATGDSRWNWAQLDTLIASPNSYRMSGDVFYVYTATTDDVLRFLVDDPANVALFQALVFDGTDPDTWTPVALNIREDYPYSYFGNSSGFAEVPLEAGHSYIIAVLQMRGVSNFPPFGIISMQYTTRATNLTFTWEVVPNPSNDDFVNREDLGSASPGTTLVADSRGSTVEEGEPVGVSNVATGVWYEYEPPTTGWYQFYLGAALPGFSVPYFDFFRGTDFTDFELSFSNAYYRPIWLRAGDTYYIRLNPVGGTGYDHISIDFEHLTALVASNDDFADRIIISGSSGTEMFDLTGASTEYGEPVMYHWNATQQPSLWYEWTAPADGGYRFIINNDNQYDFVELGIYTGDSLDDLTPIARFSAEDTAVGFEAESGTVYQIQVGYYPYFFPDPGDILPFELEWEPYAVATNTTFDTATTLTGTVGSTSANTFGALAVPELGTPDIGTVALEDEYVRYGRIAWFKFVPVVTGDYEFRHDSWDWDGFMAMYQGSTLAGLVIANDGNSNNPAATDTGWGDSYIDVRMTAGQTYYLLVGGITWPYDYNSDPTFEELPGSLHEPDMIPQGEFSLSWASISLSDDLSEAGEDENHLNVWMSYSYGGSANFEEYGPYYSYPSGVCKIGSTVGATAEPGEPSVAGGFPATRTVWFQFQPGSHGVYEIKVEGIGDTPVLDPMFAVYNWHSSYNPALLGAKLNSSDNFDGLYPRTNVSLSGFFSYFIVVDARDEGSFLLTATRVPDFPPPANDDFADATVISQEDGVLSGSTMGATVECGETPSAGFWGGPNGSVWYTFTPEENGIAFIEFAADETPEGAFSMVDIFQGTALENLINITPADDYGNASFGLDDPMGIPFPVLAGVPIYIRVMTDADSNYNVGDGGAGADFTLELLVQNNTPPDNDDGDDATDAGSGSNPGSTDGSTVEPGEPDPAGAGPLTETDPGAGTTWHKYVAPEDGFVDIYTTRPVHWEHWYRVGVWEGETRTTTIRAATPLMYNWGQFSRGTPNGATVAHYEVRKDQTYWIQVIRAGHQSWGEYTLHIDEYLETVDWSLEEDGFTSTTGSPAVSGGVLTCTGNQDDATALEVAQQYATVDLGASIPKWGRETRIYYELRVNAGQALYQERWYGGDNYDFNSAASNAEILYGRHLGLLRVRNKSGVHVLSMDLAESKAGENLLTMRTASGSVSAPLSLGRGSAVHDQGWTTVELVMTAHNGQRWDGSDAPFDHDSNVNPNWTIRMIVNGRPVSGTLSLHTGYYVYGEPPPYPLEQPRFIDFGMHRHPQQYGDPVTQPGASDQRYVENIEPFAFDMRRLRATNKVNRDPYEMEFRDDEHGIFEFDGWVNQVTWGSLDNYYVTQNETDHSWRSNIITPGSTLPIEDAPEKPGEGAVHSASYRYGMSSGAHRFYTISYYAVTFPGSKSTLSNYGGATQFNSSTGAGVLLVGPDGKLWLRPYGVKEYCVAQLALESWYFIEVHVNYQVMWNVQCTVWINGVSFGTFGSGFTYAEMASYPAQQAAPDGPYPAQYEGDKLLTFGSAGSGLGDFYITNTTAGLGLPTGAVGPLKAITVSAANGMIEHGIPDEPDDFIDLPASDGGNLYKLYNWMNIMEDPGPITVTANAEGNGSGPMPVFSPRFWETYFTLRPTTPLVVDSFQSGSPWTGTDRLQIGDGVAASANAPTQYLRCLAFGQSVPLDAIVVGIDVRVHRRASGAVEDLSVTILKNATSAGSDMNQGSLPWSNDWEVAPYGGPEELWGTTWTPQEINSPGFGVAIQAEGSGVAEIDKVTIKVYFADPGGPEAIGRGSFLPPSGLYNLYADDAVVVFNASGPVSHGSGWPTGGWEPGGPAGGFGGLYYASLYPLWLWQARGDKTPYYNVSGAPGAQGQASNFRIVRNPLTYPRFAWSADSGASWTWIYPGESEAENHIGGNVSNTQTTDLVFLDNAAALDRYSSHDGGWASGLNEDRPTASLAYRYAQHYLSFIGGNTAEPEIKAINVWARWRGYSGYPKVGIANHCTFKAYLAYFDGSIKRVGTYSNSNTAPHYNGPGPWFNRFTVPRQPNNEKWTPEVLSELQIRVGFNNATAGSAFGAFNNQGAGAAIYDLSYEVLIPAEPDPPPPPCAAPLTHVARIVKKV